MDKQRRKQIIESYKRSRAVGGVFAVRNNSSGKTLIQYTSDIKGSRNRFEFSRNTGSCAFKQLQEDYKKFGAEAFAFEVLEELEQKEGQSDESFMRDIETLYGIIKEHTPAEKLY